MGFLKGLVELFISKKKIIGYVAALIIAAVAAFLGMSAQEVRDAVIAGPVIEAPVVAQPISAPAQEKK